MLRIRKEIKNQDGTITEVEGTEAEVEAYERKQEKKRQSETVKKERKLLLDSAKALGKMTKKDLLELIQKALAENLDPLKCRGPRIYLNVISLENRILKSMASIRDFVLPHLTAFTPAPTPSTKRCKFTQAHPPGFLEARRYYRRTRRCRLPANAHPG